MGGTNRHAYASTGTVPDYTAQWLLLIHVCYSVMVTANTRVLQRNGYC